MKFYQINLHHSKAASANLVYLLENRQIDVALVQEPWLAGGKIRGLNTKETILYKTAQVGRNSSFRTCIVARKQFNLFLLSKYSNLDQTAVKLERDGLPPLIIASCYMPGDGTEGPPAELTCQLVLHAAETEHDLVLGCDANAHHSQWGSTDINNRGESVFEFIIKNNLLIANRGREPTFVTKNCKEVLDITLTNNSGTVPIEQWRVSKELSFSDHKIIEFLIPDTITSKKPFRNLRNTNWDTFNRELENRINSLENNSIIGPDSLDRATTEFTEILNKAFEKGCPLKQGRKGNKKPPWWTHEIGTIRKETRRLFNTAKRTRNELDWEAYKNSQRKFKAETQRAKRSSWQTFCTQIEGTNESARLRKILAKEPVPLGSLKGPNDQWTESCGESLELLIKTHFPGCNFDVNNTEDAVQREHTVPPDIITEDKINWAINSFSPYKSPGPDGIFPLMLQKNTKHVTQYLKSFFISSLKWEYIPLAWREVKVVFIPKAGKPSHTEAKDYRPISLTSFVLKTFERLIDIHIRSILKPNVLSPVQHAYTKGKSVETALHNLVGIVETTLKNKEYTLAAFLDIEGAFNNVQNDAVKRALIYLEVDNSLINWIISMLKYRRINSELGDAQIKVSTSRGTPQGGVLSPLLWILVMNEILIELEHSGVKVVAYADDLALLATGKFLSTTSEQINYALSKVCSWTRKCGLSVNPQKTELVLFTNKRKIPDFVLPSIEGTRLSLSEHAKYLGVILDKKLNWGLNIKERAKKAMIAFYSCNRIFGKTWGPNPKIIMWMYTAIIRPILTYGSLVWWSAMDKETNCKTLNKVQRLACIGITGAMRSTPTAGMETILNLKPLDLLVQETAAYSALRLSQTNSWKRNSVGHAQISNKFTEGYVCTDYTTPRTVFEKPFSVSIPTREEWDAGLQQSDEPMVEIYTDGSKMDTGVGAGFFSETLNLSKSYRLPDYSSVFQAEVLAVIKGAEQILMMAIPRADITFYIDSQAAIKAISATEIKSKLVSCCREELRVLATLHNIRLCWVPGHCGIEGNEKADELARTGSSLDPSLTDFSVKIPPCAIKQAINKKIVELSNDRWNSLVTCTTTKNLWPSYNKKKTDKIMNLKKRSLHLLIGIITGHNLLGYHKNKMGLSTVDLCRGCGDEEVEEDTLHYLGHCPALCNIRKKFLGSYFFNDLAEISKSIDNNILNLMNFINASKWLDAP